MKSKAEIDKIDKEIENWKNKKVFKRPKSAFITFNHTKALNLINAMNR